MNILEMAKDIIKKGTELGDSDLISMGHNMLEKYSQENSEPTLKVDFTTDLNPPDITIELKPEIKTSSFSYICENCMKEFTFTQKKRKCPECKSNKLKIREPKKDGDSKKKFAKRQPLDVSKSKYNRFIDDGTMLNDKENEYLKTKPLTPRVRKSYQPKHVVCTRCGKQEDVNPVLASRYEYICDRCIQRGSSI